ncbi:adult cuticle protein 1-like [Ochlerotatus camptorhynchus]|uniref:adult cuticle protein 1-like n=1 Tax=Ochlerotatus camptorhynchus TaxID=644619 RepID=UPI0031E3A465
MKCIIAAAVVALVFAAAEGSVVPVTYYSPGLVQQVAVPYTYSYPYAYPYSYPYAAYPYAYPAPAVVVTPQEPRYTAVNRGAYHDAPLPGHAVSQQSVNIQPAPGTL